MEFFISKRCRRYCLLNSGVLFAKKFGLEKLNEVAKVNFKNYKKILEILNKRELFDGGSYV